MKTKSALVRSIGVLLALLVFVSLPTSLLALCSTHDPVCKLYYGIGHNLFLELETDCPPSDVTIFYISSEDQPIPDNSNPCHSGATPCTGTSWVANGTKVSIPYGHTLYIRMLAWRSDTGDSGIVDCDQHNPNL
jgi:hypothetical protein